MLSMVFVMISMSTAGIRRIYEVLNETSEIHNPKHPVTEVADGSIQFKNVEFAYKKDSEEPVLKNINLDIHSGETIGHEWAGPRKRQDESGGSDEPSDDVTKGEILVGGKNVKEYDLDSLRNQVSVVLQKNVLFTGTIYDNLRWGNLEATDEECRKRAGLPVRMNLSSVSRKNMRLISNGRKQCVRRTETAALYCESAVEETEDPDP